MHRPVLFIYIYNYDKSGNKTIGHADCYHPEDYPHMTREDMIKMAKTTVKILENKGELVELYEGKAI